MLDVLSRPVDHGLVSGVWYALNADAALVESYGSHTLAGIFGCGAEHLSALRDALSSAGIHTPGASTRAVSIRKSAQRHARLHIVCEGCELHGFQVDLVWNYA